MKLPILFQRVEGAAILGASLVAYMASDFGWWLFAVLLFIFDISIVGYIVNPKVGAIIYNIGHSLVLPLLVLGIWIVSNSDALLLTTLIWFSHIGLDRLLGYGLKSPKGFVHTHLGKIRVKQKVPN